MSDNYLKDHYDAVKALIPAGETIYSGEVDESPSYPYVLLWGGIGKESGESLSGQIDHLDLRPKITYAAESFESLLIIVSRVRPALVNALPLVPGWSPSRLGQESLLDAQPDFRVLLSDKKTHPQFCVDEFPFTSQRR